MNKIILESLIANVFDLFFFLSFQSPHFHLRIFSCGHLAKEKNREMKDEKAIMAI